MLLFCALGVRCCSSEARYTSVCMLWRIMTWSDMTVIGTCAGAFFYGVCAVLCAVHAQRSTEYWKDGFWESDVYVCI